MLQHGEAYNNMTGKLYHIDDGRLPPGFERYSSPYKQWVTESGVGNGAYVPSNVSGAGTLVNKEDPLNGYYIDFDNGGVVVTGANASPNMNWSGEFSVKRI